MIPTYAPSIKNSCGQHCVANVRWGIKLSAGKSTLGSRIVCRGPAGDLQVSLPFLTFNGQTSGNPSRHMLTPCIALTPPSDVSLILNAKARGRVGLTVQLEKYV